MNIVEVNALSKLLNLKSIVSYERYTVDGVENDYPIYKVDIKRVYRHNTELSIDTPPIHHRDFIVKYKNVYIDPDTFDAFICITSEYTPKVPTLNNNMSGDVFTNYCKFIKVTGDMPNLGKFIVDQTIMELMNL